MGEGNDEKYIEDFLIGTTISITRKRVIQVEDFS